MERGGLCPLSFPLSKPVFTRKVVWSQTKGSQHRCKTKSCAECRGVPRTSIFSILFENCILFDFYWEFEFFRFIPKFLIFRQFALFLIFQNFKCFPIFSKNLNVYDFYKFWATLAFCQRRIGLRKSCVQARSECVNTPYVAPIDSSPLFPGRVRTLSIPFIIFCPGRSASNYFASASVVWLPSLAQSGAPNHIALLLPELQRLVFERSDQLLRSSPTLCMYWWRWDYMVDRSF